MIQPYYGQSWILAKAIPESIHGLVIFVQLMKQSYLRDDQAA
jgi:hypothetical protein